MPPRSEAAKRGYIVGGLALSCGETPLRDLCLVWPLLDLVHDTRKGGDPGCQPNAAARARRTNHPGPGVGVRAKEENQDRGHERCGCRPLVRRHNVVIALCDIKRARVVEHIKAAGFTDATETQAAFREAALGDGSEHGPSLTPGGAAAPTDELKATCSRSGDYKQIIAQEAALNGIPAHAGIDAAHTRATGFPFRRFCSCGLANASTL